MGRCIHCYKEVRDNQVFCNNCGRPVSRRYKHCTSEIYDGFAWQDILSKLPDRDNKPLYKTTYTDSTENNGAAKASEKNLQIPGNLNIPNVAKAVIWVGTFIMLILPTIIGILAGPHFYSPVPESEFEDAVNVIETYEMPEMDSCYISRGQDMENAVEGSSSLVLEYLTMLHDMVEYIGYDPVKSRDTLPPYTLEKIDEVMNRMEEVVNYYDTGESFSEVYGEIVKLHEEWNIWIYPGVEELLNDYKMTELDGVELYTYEYLNEGELIEFSNHVVYACQYYLNEK